VVKRSPERLDRDELQRAAPAPLNRQKLLLGAALLLPAMGWSLHLALAYGLVYPAQDWHSKTPLHLVSLGSALVCAGGALLGWRALRGARERSEAPDLERTRFMARSACAMGIFFFIATLAQSVPALMLGLWARP
jgi:hypothetical protein